jgi:ABC-type transport system involved in cytochrome bd biosynthesis fused ATPase/permease subunit
MLGSVEVQFYHRWFDVIFLVSALLSILFIYLVQSQHQSSVADEFSSYGGLAHDITYSTAATKRNMYERHPY